MVSNSSSVSLADVKTPKAGGLVVVGYSATAAGLLVFLTINGESGVPTAAVLLTAGLLTIGLLLPAAGMLWLRRGFDSTPHAKRGYGALALGLVGLFFGVLLVYESSLSGSLLSAAIITASGVLAMAGTVLLRKHYRAIGTKSNNVVQLALGTALTFSGVGLITGSKIALYYFISQLQSTVYMDMGATVSAYGCVIAAYSFFVLHFRKYSCDQSPVSCNTLLMVSNGKETQFKTWAPNINSWNQALFGGLSKFSSYLN